MTREKAPANWPAKMTHHGECYIDFERTGKAPGFEQPAGGADYVGSGGRLDGSELTPRTTHADRLLGLWCSFHRPLPPRPQTSRRHARGVGNLAHIRRCDGSFACEADISSGDWGALREARKAATLCPDCQDRVDSPDIEPELYGMGRHTTAHLYAVPVLEGFDAIRNCSHCRRNTDDNCKAWREAGSRWPY